MKVKVRQGEGHQEALRSEGDLGLPKLEDDFAPLQRIDLIRRESLKAGQGVGNEALQARVIKILGRRRGEDAGARALHCADRVVDH